MKSERRRRPVVEKSVSLTFFRKNPRRSNYSLTGAKNIVFSSQVVSGSYTRFVLVFQQRKRFTRAPVFFRVFQPRRRFNDRAIWFLVNEPDRMLMRHSNENRESNFRRNISRLPRSLFIRPVDGRKTCFASRIHRVFASVYGDGLVRQKRDLVGIGLIPRRRGVNDPGFRWKCIWKRWRTSWRTEHSSQHGV